MNSIRVRTTGKLCGEVAVQGCKNAVLPMLAATLLNEKINIIHNCPRLSDVADTLEMLNLLGAKAEIEGNTITVDSSSQINFEIPPHIMGRLRSSVILAAPVLSRCKKVKFTMPGGCEIGTRPIDIHLASFEKMGVDVECCDGTVVCDCSNLHGADIHLPVPSVGATENVMLLAAKGRGVTTIYNAAKEPEIVDVARFLNSMGARVFGAGTSQITVYAVNQLGSSEYTVMPDRIEAITFACACASAGGIVKLNNINYNHISGVMSLLSNMGISIVSNDTSVTVSSYSKPKCPPLVSTRPYPGFPTDAQSLFMSVMSVSNGSGMVAENIFEDRLRHALELKKMGADITVNGNRALITGTSLCGARVNSCDLRSGAALVVAALAAKGESYIEKCEYIDRGYENFAQKLINLGADIERLKYNEQ